MGTWSHYLVLRCASPERRNLVIDLLNDIKPYVISTCSDESYDEVLLSLSGKEYLNGPNEIRDQRPRQLATELWDRKEYGGNYFTVRSAQRFSATLSIRPSRRVTNHRYVIGKHKGIGVYERTRRTCNICDN